VLQGVFQLGEVVGEEGGEVELPCVEKTMLVASEGDHATLVITPA
jgi:hypothetical protein